MKKIVVTIVAVFVVGANIFLLLPAQATQGKTGRCDVSKCAKLELSELNAVNPGILPNLLKS
ncbi:MAG TPA: hypothetical protein VMR70_03335 [Flavisolibacter sp.]|nr:hypothetical protein [Flavisolibacter sp.]